MKIDTKLESKPFRECSITFTFESQTELDILGSLFNVSCITGYLENHGMDHIDHRIYERFRNLGANIDIQRWRDAGLIAELT